MSSEIVEGGVYRLVNVRSGTALDLSAKHHVVHGWDLRDNDNQKWRLGKDNGHWTFQNIATGRYLAIDGQAQNGAGLVPSDSPVHWDIWPDEENQSVHRIFVPDYPHPGSNIDLDCGKRENGTKIHLWEKIPDHKQQVWKFEKVN